VNVLTAALVILTIALAAAAVFRLLSGRSKDRSARDTEAMYRERLAQNDPDRRPRNPRR